MASLMVAAARPGSQASANWATALSGGTKARFSIDLMLFTFLVVVSIPGSSRPNGEASAAASARPVWKPSKEPSGTEGGPGRP